jgi:hypothetical protein
MAAASSWFAQQQWWLWPWIPSPHKYTIILNSWFSDPIPILGSSKAFVRQFYTKLTHLIMNISILELIMWTCMWCWTCIRPSVLFSPIFLSFL